MNPSNFFIGLWSALLLMVGLLAPATAAAQRADEGEYLILQARYGTAARNVDVTPRLKELARRDRNFRAGNETLGIDPHPERVKVLRIYARGKDGSVRTFEYAENEMVDGRLFKSWGGGSWGNGYNGGWGGAVVNGSSNGSNNNNRPGNDAGEYQILQARYGTAERNTDVTARLKDLASRDNTFRASNRAMGMDPDPGQVKVLRIFARGRDGHNRTFEYPEDALVDGALFTGWGSGKWGNGGWGGGWGEAEHAGSNDKGYDSNAARGQLNILSASYGAGERQRDITYRLRARVSNGRLDVRADNELAGADPAPETPKNLWVTYSVGGGREQRLRVDENERIRLP